MLPTPNHLVEGLTRPDLTCLSSGVTRGCTVSHSDKITRVEGVSVHTFHEGCGWAPQRGVPQSPRCISTVAAGDRPVACDAVPRCLAHPPWLAPIPGSCHEPPETTGRGNVRAGSPFFHCHRVIATDFSGNREMATGTAKGWFQCVQCTSHCSSSGTSVLTVFRPHQRLLASAILASRWLWPEDPGQSLC